MRVSFAIQTHGRVLFAVFSFLAVLVVQRRSLTAEGILFESHIRPIFDSKCGKCHSDKVSKGGLDLSTVGRLRRGGESGEPLVAESLAESKLWSMIVGNHMPPKGEPRLTGEETEALRQWIEQGGRLEGHSGDVLTQHDVLPYLYARCVACHGPRKKEADLDLRTVESILKGGKSGPAVIPGKPEESLLIKRVLARDMPPPKQLVPAGVRPLDPSEIALISKWIAQGAKHYDVVPDVQTTESDPLVTDEDRKFWSFQPPHKPAVPEVVGASTRSVDAFLLRKLEEHGLEFSEEASRLTLIRRVAFDLTGLPPDWQDVRRFLDDPSTGWYDNLVDFYLESSHYGEHWGRHWLDLCGYSDSEGKANVDPVREHAWRYRDYVIRSLNADKPYNRFLLEQLAGDDLYDFENAKVITDDMMEALIATGFLRMAPDGTGLDIVNTVKDRFEVVADEIEVLGSAVLGLTLRCAQCHTHKYDPIPQRDYYRLVAVFQGAFDVYDWLKPHNDPSRFLRHVTQEVREDWKREKAPLEEAHLTARKKLNERRDALRAEFVAQKLAEFPDALREDLRAMLKMDSEKRSVVQKYLAEKFEKQLTLADKDLGDRHPELKKLEEETEQLRKRIPPEPRIRALWDRGEPSPTWVLRRGQYNNPGDLVGPGVLSVLSDGRTPLVIQPRRKNSTGRRLAFAEWLVDPEHPLTARVLVNRVWSRYFGRGIVETVANFGTMGSRPTHPELLDWLAVSFVENGWSLKWLHRQILRTEAYRQSSQWSERLDRLDPDNRWLSRVPLRRLTAESVRDGLLAIAGRLDRTPFGAPDLVDVREDGLVTARPRVDGWRRTVYVQQRRKEIPTILETFDLPQMNPNCIERPRSTVALQALHLFNNRMIRQLSEEFAKRVEAEVPLDRARQIDRVYEIALSRPPGPLDKKYAIDTLDALTTRWRQSSSGESGGALPAETRALANFCHVVMNSAAFLFVD